MADIMGSVKCEREPCFFVVVFYHCLNFGRQKEEWLQEPVC